MKQNLKIILFTLIVEFIFLTGGLLWFIYHGVGAQDDPTWMETTLAGWVRNASVSAATDNQKNPFPPTPDNLKEGREHFADMCAVCHANNGSGKPTIAAHMYPRSPDLRTKATQSLSDAELFYIIQNGIRLSGMPGWPSHGAEDNWKLVLFLRHLPTIASAEEQEMERFNPVAAEEHHHEK